ncbi:MAG: FAD-dependent oxidoreductase [Turicibacter sp.]|nr:FAD-dependent oxidoreductase [Turicibacter sp.]
MNVAPKVAKVIREVDVLVVGGGPAGIGAAVSAAYDGDKVLLLEKGGFLGGNITKSYVEGCNYFLRGTGFEPTGVWAKMEAQYKEAYGRAHDLRPNSPFRYSSEYLKIFLDRFMKDNNVEVLFHSFVNDVVMEDEVIKAVIIQTKQGPQAIVAKTVVDCSGDADVAFAAGVTYDQGRETDGLTQPGTLSFRVAGVDSATLLEDGKDVLKRIAADYKKEYRAGKTGLSCKRQDLPFGRLTAGGQVSYLNYACAYGIDSTDIVGLTQGEQESRVYIQEMLDYMRANMPGFERAELSSIATEVSFRDSRRIKGKYHLTIEDLTTTRQFEDCIAVYPQFYDMLAPDAYMDGDGSIEGAGYKGHIYKMINDGSLFQVPYRALVPQGVSNLLVAGRSISCDHVAQSGIRAISCCMATGEAAGAAAALASQQGISAEDVNVMELQKRLRGQGVRLA